MRRLRPVDYQKLKSTESRTLLETKDGLAYAWYPCCLLDYSPLLEMGIKFFWIVAVLDGSTSE